MAKSKKTPEPTGASVPAYIVTFSDMVTLLLTFFVMLLSLAQVQDPDLFNRSRDAFNEHINCYGLGLLTGKQLVPEFGQKKVKYHIPDPDDNAAARTIDSKEETLRRLFLKAAESMEAMPSRVGVKLSDYAPTEIYFEKGRADLNEAAEAYLERLTAEQRQRADTQTQVYVLGLAPDEAAGKQQWVLSSQRAQHVADYLETLGLKCPVYTWGGGPGGDWINEHGPVTRQSQILIAFVRKD
jgi:chemotaxis protein MotB